MWARTRCCPRCTRRCAAMRAVLEVLFRIGAVETVDEGGRTLIHEAALCGSYEALLRLLERDASKAKHVDVTGNKLKGLHYADYTPHQRTRFIYLNLLRRFFTMAPGGVQERTRR
eukprot:TRINITY_DN5201_c2_g1_i1.p3 TRINITY_DN5201_c2_g1~~TRINITY_DN5201_c2_g1_i1.p3  ORF type:complete len:115 (+),score=10.93 TRINITY_DN5201_c2_g1_i1:144-488(+)